MATPTNVKELFAPLEERFLQFETNRFSTHYYDDNRSWEDFDIYTPNIFKIAKNASLFDPQDVYDEARFLESRVHDIIGDLKPLEKINVKDDFGERDVIKLPEGFKNVLLQRWKEEFDNYKTQLQAIQKLALRRIEATPMKSKDKAPATIEVKEINLPDNFTVTNLSTNFKAKVSQSHVALLFYYFGAKKMIPKFTNLSLGRLAEALFGRNQKNVATSLTKIHDIRQSEKELLEFKDILLSLINDVDEDLKEAR